VLDCGGYLTQLCARDQAVDAGLGWGR